MSVTCSDLVSANFAVSVGKRANSCKDFTIRSCPGHSLSMIELVPVVGATNVRIR